MEDQDRLGCDLIEIVSGKVSGAPVFKNTRLPVSALVENVDAFIEIDGLSLDDAISETLRCYPSTPGVGKAIRKVFEFRNAHEPILQS